MNYETPQRKMPVTWREYFSFGDTSRVFRWIWTELIGSESKRWALKMIIALILATILASITPIFVAQIFNNLPSGNAGSIQQVWIGLLGLLVLSILEKCLNWMQSAAREWQLGLNHGTLDHRMTSLFLEKSPSQHIQEKSRLNSASLEKGRSRVLNLQGMLLFEGIPAVVTLLASLLFLWMYWPVAGFGMTGVLFFHLLWTLYLNRKVLLVCDPIERDLRRLNRYRADRLDKVIRVKTVGTESRELAYMRDWFDRVISLDRKFWLWFIRQATARDIMNIVGSILIFGYGIYQVFYHGMSYGMLYPLFVWTMRVRDNIWRLGSVEHQINWNMPPIKHLMEALIIEPDTIDHPNAIVLPKKPVHIEFNQVSHSYEKKDASGALRENIDAVVNINFTIEPGEKMALIGPSGSGKSTIAKLLLRYMDPTSGSILVDGIPLSHIKRNSWMNIVGHIPQKPETFDGSIEYNMLYAVDGQRVPDEELKMTVEMLQINFADGIDGLSAKVGYDGIELSGGQNQRLAAAAAIMNKPPLLVIDEASSSLDSTTEKAFQLGLDTILAGNQSALIIAHRFSTLKNCNKIVVLRDKHDPKNKIFGTQIDAVGNSFEELYEKSEIFRQLADDQDFRI